MLDALSRTGWRNYSLFLGADGLLVGYLETPDFAAAVAAMEATDVNARWQAEMAEFFELPSGDRPDTGLVRLEEVFHLACAPVRGDRSRGDQRAGRPGAPDRGARPARGAAPVRQPPGAPPGRAALGPR